MTAEELRGVLHRLADAAIMADDAIARADAESLVRATEIMTAHVATIRAHIPAIIDAMAR